MFGTGAEKVMSTSLNGAFKIILWNGVSDKDEIRASWCRVPESLNSGTGFVSQM